MRGKSLIVLAFCLVLILGLGAMMSGRPSTTFADPDTPTVNSVEDRWSPLPDDSSTGLGGQSTIATSADSPIHFVCSYQLLGSGNVNVAYTADGKLGDLDNDGDLDILAATQGVQVLLNDGSGEFTQSRVPVGANALGIGDLDNDGDLDFVSVSLGENKVWFNDGAANFHHHQTLGEEYSTSVALGDLDKDGDLDILIGNRGEYGTAGQPNRVWFNDGHGHFLDSGQSLGMNKTYDVTLGDLDGDGYLDAVVVSGYQQDDEVWLNDGTGHFTKGSTLNTGWWSHGVDVGDLDDDGDLDVIVAINSFDLPVYMNDGRGNFSVGQTLGDVTRGWEVSINDLDGDGDLDVLTGNVTAWENDGSGLLTRVQSFDNKPSHGVAVGDLDGDGDLDFFVGHPWRDRVWFNEPVGHADVAVHKSVTPSSPVRVGEVLTYTLIIANNGPHWATNVVMEDILPAELEFEHGWYGWIGPMAYGRCHGHEGREWCEIPELYGLHQFVAIIRTRVIEPGIITNKASVKAGQVDPNPGNNISSISTLHPAVLYLPLIRRPQAPPSVITVPPVNQ